MQNLTPPPNSVGPSAPAGAVTAAANLALSPSLELGQWRELGPFVPNVPGPGTYTGVPTRDSGRIASFAISPLCRSASDCLPSVAATGRAASRSDNALHPHPQSQPSRPALSS